MKKILRIPEFNTGKKTFHSSYMLGWANDHLQTYSNYFVFLLF